MGIEGNARGMARKPEMVTSRDHAYHIFNTGAENPIGKKMEELFGDPPHKQAAVILHEIFPDAINHWLGKTEDYEESSDDLGSAGQYAELHRKMGKLKKALWYGKPLVGEQPPEILEDLMAHCALAIYALKKEGIE